VKHSTRPAIVASRSLVRGQPTERQSGRGSLRPGGRSEAGEGIDAARRTTCRSLPAFTLPERIIGPALIIDLLPIELTGHGTGTKGRDTRDTRRSANVSGRDVPLLRRVLFDRRGLQTIAPALGGAKRKGSARLFGPVGPVLSAIVFSLLRGGGIATLLWGIKYRWGHGLPISALPTYWVWGR
jgi:hypothetical protein